MVSTFVQHLVNQVMSTFKRLSFNIVESVNNVESLLKQIYIGLNFHSTSLRSNIFLCSRKCWMVLKPFEHFVQHLFPIPRN